MSNTPTIRIYLDNETISLGISKRWKNLTKEEKYEYLKQLRETLDQVKQDIILDYEDYFLT